MFTIIRGMPGSGKSTAARALAAENHALFLEPDMMLYQDGSYRYSQKAFEKALCDCSLIMGRFFLNRKKAHLVYADVLPRIRDVQMVILFSGSKEFQVFDMPLITVEESLKRNTHAVRKEDLQRFYEKWEPWTKEDEETLMSYQFYLKGLTNTKRMV